MYICMSYDFVQSPQKLEPKNDCTVLQDLNKVILGVKMHSGILGIDTVGK